MRLEFRVCTCHWMTHPPCQPAPSLGWERRARRRRRSRRGQRSAGARCTRPPPPPVPLCHEPALTPGTELCGRSVPRKRVAGLLACCSQVYPGSRFHPEQGQQELSWLISGAVSGSSSRGSQGLESPLQCHLPNVFVRMEGSPAACQRSSASRELLVFTGVSAHPRSLAPSSREEGTGRRYGRGTENVGRDPPSPVITPPSSSQIPLFKHQ